MAIYIPSLPSLPEKLASHHIWETRIKGVSARKMKYAHNSVTSNLEYPKEKVKQGEKESKSKDRFAIIGSRLTQEFLYCKKLVKELHWRRPRVFDNPEIRGVTAVEWPQIWNDLNSENSNTVYFIYAPVVVLINGHYLGGPEELKKYLEEKYELNFTLNINYCQESLKEFKKLCCSTNRPHVYMNFSVNGASIGCMIFMLYSDLVPRTCENFIRLCKEKKGGYKGTPVHRIVKDCWIQCGGFGLKSTDLNCENFIIDFDRRGVLGMANSERHVDCSTQFFVLSQPAEWMNTQYVAFGQLIEGENTLKQIDEIPTWYESPTQEVIISDAGILNMECQRATINKGAAEYVFQHIENTIGFINILFEELLDMVILEVDERGRLWRQIKESNIFPSKKYNSETSEYSLETADDASKRVSDILQDTKICGDKISASNASNDVPSNARTISLVASSNKTNVLEPLVDPERPYYFPLTDVPYPGEIDSITDLKRYLQGHYCLEADIDDKNNANSLMNLPKITSDNEELQYLMLLSSESSNDSLDSEIENEINNHYRQVGEKKSYSRKVMRGVAKSLNFKNLTDIIEAKTVFADEELRKIKNVTRDLKSALEPTKRISIEARISRDLLEKNIKRRQTGFIRGKDLRSLLSHLHKDESDDEEEEEDDDDNDDDVCDDVDEKESAKHKPRPVEVKQNTEDNEKRKSTLLKLIEEVDTYNEEGGRPTLKNYQSILEERPDIKSEFMKASTHIADESTDSIIKIHMHRPLVSRSSLRQMSGLYTPGSFVNVDKHASIDASNNAKFRPSITVKEYREQNRIRQA